MAKNGLRRIKQDKVDYTPNSKKLRIWVMAEIPANIMLVEEFGKVFDGFSIGSNDLTQLTLGLDRDNKQIAHIGNEKNEAVKSLIRDLIKRAHKIGLHVGICGQGPSDFPDFAEFLVREGIDSISLQPDTVLKTSLSIKQVEDKMKRRK
jgi:pyruvate,water dikinase